MYNPTPYRKTSIKRNLYEVGETIEQKVLRILTTNEPITDTAPPIYTERKQGVIPDYNPRTDKFEYAAVAMDTATATQLAKRQELLKKPETPETSPGENSPEAKP